jgi:hypothetical protein
MATFKITSPQVVGKLKLPAESAGKALQISATGEVESSTVTTAELANLSGITSAAVSVNGTQTLTNKTLTSPVVNSPTGIVKADVGLSNVDNTSDATKNAAIVTLTNKTIDATSNTISNIADANISSSAAIAQSKISGLVSDLAGKEATANKGVANGYASLDSGGKVPVAQLPNSIMEYQGTYDASTNTPILANGAGNADTAIGDVYRVTVAGAGVNSLNFIVGDYVILNSSKVWEKAHSGADAVVSVNGFAGVVVLTKSDIGLSNVDNTSDATKNSATATLTNKTIDATSNTISNIATTNLASGVLNTSTTMTGASNTQIPSALAIKTYADSLVGASAVAGDIGHTSFTAANNVVTATDVTGFAFAAGTVRSFRAQVSVSINATTALNEVFTLDGIQLAGGFVMAQTSVGDDSGVVFTITSAGQIQYSSANSAGFVSNTIKFRASVTNV